MARPYVDGKLIKDPSGRPIVLVGANKHRSITYYKDPSAWIDEVDAVYDLLRGCGATVVKYAVNRWAWDNNPDQYKLALDGLIAKCKARGLYVILCWQEWHEWWRPDGGDIDHLTWEDKARIIVEYNDWENFIVQVAQRYKDNHTVIGIEPMNEPPHHEGEWLSGAGISLAEGEQIWNENQLKMIDAIHAVDPNYLVFAYKLNYLNLKGYTPYNRPNIVYGIHHYYGWDVGYNEYADLYFNAVTEQDFRLAYEAMVRYYKDIMLNFRDAYNVPVANTETSIAKIDYHTRVPLNNKFRQFEDQMKLMAEYGVHDIYHSCDRDYGGNYHGLLDSTDTTKWSEAGVLWAANVEEYFPRPPVTQIAGVGLVLVAAILLLLLALVASRGGVKK